MAGRLTEKPGDSFGDHAPLLGAGPALDEHVQVQFLGRKPFQRILADGPEPVLLHIAEQAVLEVCIPQFPGIVRSENPFHVRGWQDLPHHIEDGVVVQGVADLL